jgi:hypothetical protein
VCGAVAVFGLRRQVADEGLTGRSFDRARPACGSA